MKRRHGLQVAEEAGAAAAALVVEGLRRVREDDVGDAVLQRVPVGLGQPPGVKALPLLLRHSAAGVDVDEGPLRLQVVPARPVSLLDNVFAQEFKYLY